MQRSQELEKEKETLKARQTDVSAEVQRATEEEIPLRQVPTHSPTLPLPPALEPQVEQPTHPPTHPPTQELMSVQAQFDSLKASHDKEDGERQRQRIECTQRYQAFEALQAKLKDAQSKGLAEQLTGLEEEKGRLEVDIQHCQAQVGGWVAG